MSLLPRSGVITEKKETTIVLSQGIPDQHKVVLEGEGHENYNLKPGNLILVVNIIPNQQYLRIDNDLELEVNMTIKEALMGLNARSFI